MKKRSSLLIGSILGLLLAVSVISAASLAWLTGVNQIEPSIGSSVITQYFERGSGTADDPFIIHTPRHLYNLAWLQYQGQFNEADAENPGSVRQFYFELCVGGEDCEEESNPEHAAVTEIDMTGWTLPPIGTATYPFLGHFDGNGVTISNLTVSGRYDDLTDTADTEASFLTHSYGGANNGCNVTGLFGVVGSTGTAGTSGGLSYATADNTISNVTVKDITVKTPSGAALAGLAAGYVNAALDNVRAVGGTITNPSGSTTATTLTANLSDYGVVGYCTEDFRVEDESTDVALYRPQYLTSGGSGSETGQGNNWGGSVNMLDMYTNLRSVYTNATTTSVTYDSLVTVTHHADGTQTTETETATANLSVTAGGYTFPIKVSTVEDAGDTIASYSIVQRDDTADFVYLYGEHTVSTVSQTERHIHEVELPAIVIHSGTNYLTFNGTAFGNTTTAADAAKWVNENGRLYTLVNNDPERKVYMAKSASNALTNTAAVGINDAAPLGATVWTIETDAIYSGDRYLCYQGGTWRLIRNENGLITESTETNYLTVSGSPAAITNVTDKTAALNWSKSGTSNFTLSVEVDGRTYYLMCSSSGVLSLAENPASPTQWNEVLAIGDAKPKIYTLTTETTGYALYYDSSTGKWNTTGYATTGAGDNWGGSIDIKTLNTRLYTQFQAYASSSTTLGSATTPVAVNDAKFYLTRSAQGDPNSSSVIYRWRTGTIVPINATDSLSAKSSNTGYFVGSSITTNTVNGSPKSSSYYIDYLCYSLSNASATAAKIRSHTQASYDPETLEIVTRSGSNWVRIEDSYNEGNRTVNSQLSGYNRYPYADLGLQKYQEARDALNDILLKDDGTTSEAYVNGIHFDTNAVSSSSTLSITAKILGQTYSNYAVPLGCIDFSLKDSGYVNFFAGSYYNLTGDTGSSSQLTSANLNDSFFSLHHIITRSADKRSITSMKEISKIYQNTDAATTSDIHYVYQYTDGAYSTGTAGSLLFDMQYLWDAAPKVLTLYYFEIPVNSGEYALGAVKQGNTVKSKGAYLLYLDISANATTEGDSKFGTDTVSGLTTNHTAATLAYSYTDPDIQNDVDIKTYPTYYPLAWENGVVANSNTGYVVSGANTNSTPPGDIRVARYSKYANGNWSSIRNSLTTPNAAGVLNNSRVYTIVNGTQQSITAYGIGNQYTMRYASVAAEMNDLLRGNDYVYGLHFMQASISSANTVTAPKAVINGTTYTDYEMPQDCIDFRVAAKGRVTFMAGTFFSGSNGTRSFFSLHQILRDGEGHISSIKKLSAIYGNGISADGYFYRYDGDSNYYRSDGTLYGASLPSGYAMIFDTTVLSSSRTLTQNSVYYFEVPVDPGEFALGSADGDGAYLIYLDIAANATFNVGSTVTELLVSDVHLHDYPQGAAFVDAAGSTAFNTDGTLDPAQSVFLSIPSGAASSGSTAFAINSSHQMTVTGASDLDGFVTRNIPDGGKLTVNGTEITSAGRLIYRETVTEIDSDFDGRTTTTVTRTTQTLENGVRSTTVDESVLTEFAGTQESYTETSATENDHDPVAIPTDYTVDPAQPADTILEYAYVAQGLSDTYAHGELNVSDTGVEVTIDGESFTAYNIMDGDYALTISGTSGTYEIDVSKCDSDFSFTVNGTSVTTETTYDITVSSS